MSISLLARTQIILNYVHEKSREQPSPEWASALVYAAAVQTTNLTDEEAAAAFIEARAELQANGMFQVARKMPAPTTNQTGRG